MPTGNPQVGETWESSDLENRMVRGIISDIDPNRVVFVSLFGHRTNVPSSRLGTVWHFAAAVPETPLRCSRRGCTRPGMLRIQRGLSPDWLCPRHVPVGVLAEIHTPGAEDPNRATPPAHVIQCYECGNPDPVEDNRSGRLDRGEAGWWTCTLCSCRWGVIAPPEEGADAGRWYTSALLHLMSEASRIEMSPVVWESLDWNLRRYFDNVGESPAGLNGTFYGVPFQVRFTLAPGIILLHAPRVGRGSPSATNLLGRPRPSLSYVPNIGGSATQLLSDHAAVLEQIAKQRPRPRSGQWYVHRTSMQFAEVMQVIEDQDGYAVSFRHAALNGMPNAPVVLVADTFHGEYMPHSAGAPDPKPISADTVALNEGEEWFCVLHNDYVDITDVDPVRGTAHTVGKRTGRARTFTLADFARPDQFRKIVKRTAYERILDDD